MVMKNILLISLILGLLITFGINTYYPDSMVSDIGQAALDVTDQETVLASATGSVIVYFIVVAALYLFLRSVIKTFGA